MIGYFQFTIYSFGTACSVNNVRHQFFHVHPSRPGCRACYIGVKFSSMRINRNKKLCFCFSQLSPACFQMLVPTNFILSHRNSDRTREINHTHKTHWNVMDKQNYEYRLVDQLVLLVDTWKNIMIRGEEQRTYHISRNWGWKCMRCILWKCQSDWRLMDSHLFSLIRYMQSIA